MMAGPLLSAIALATAASAQPSSTIDFSKPPPVATSGSRADENAVRQAGDAFGTSIGREVIGLYNQQSVRGFSPVAAGNVRIEGLYFDPVIVLTSRLARSTTIRVGLGALGNPFPAPTGIVDFGFRRPGDTAAASVQFGVDAWGTINAEIDAVVPVARGFSFGLGGSVKLENGADGTVEDEIGGALIARWNPAPGVQIMPFVNVSHSLRDDHRVSYVTAGDFLPPPLPRRERFGPEWAWGSNVEANMGVLADWQMDGDWLLRGGLFRSSRTIDSNFSNLVTGLQPDGGGRQRLVADPQLAYASISGELRLTRQFVEGARRHRIHLAVRSRASDRRFGGSDILNLGPVRYDEPPDWPRPVPVFGPQQRDEVRQWTGGLAYEGRWAGVGEITAGVQLSNYRKRIDLPAGGIQAIDARPLLYNLTLAANMTSRLVIYGGVVTGLEESGIAPGNAANRNEALPAIQTRQFDAGLRYALTDDVKVVAGVFDITKPYYNLDANNRFDVLGDVINRGVEISAAGPMTRTLNIVAGAILLWPRVTGQAVDSGKVGPRPVGAISSRVEISGDWRPPFLAGVSFDAKLAHRAAETSTVSNKVSIPARQMLDIGGRYRFKLARQQAMLRLQVTNVFDVEGYDLRGAGAYGAIPGRLVQGYLTVDF